MRHDFPRFEPNPPSNDALVALSQVSSKPLPSSYIAFLERANGGEGFISERCVQLWRAEELITTNDDYGVAEFAPNLFLIGSDGGGNAFAFDISTSDPTLFEVPFIGMPELLKPIAQSFDSFVAPLNS